MTYEIGKYYDCIVQSCSKKNLRTGKRLNTLTVIGPDGSHFKVHHFYKKKPGTDIRCMVDGYDPNNNPILKVAIDSYHKEPQKVLLTSTTRSIRAIPTPMGGKVK